MSDEKVKVIMDNDGVVRTFVAEGDSITYKRNDAVESRPAAVPSLRWVRKIVTTHTLTWETLSYD